MDRQQLRSDRISFSALFALVVSLSSAPGVVSAAIVQSGSLNYISDAGNPSDGLAYLDMSFSRARTLASAITNAQGTYPDARAATPAEFDDFFEAAGVVYDAGLTASDGFTTGPHGSFTAAGDPGGQLIFNALGQTSTIGVSLQIFTDPDGSDSEATTRDYMTFVASGGSGTRQSLTLPPNSERGWLLVSDGASLGIDNLDFETGDFTSWTTFVDAGGTTGSPGVLLFDTVGAGDSLAARFNVGRVNGAGAPLGGGLYQLVNFVAGDYYLKVDIATHATGQGNSAAGIYELLFDGVVVDTVDLGGIGPGSIKRDALAATLTGVSTGAHEVRVRISRGFTTNGAGTRQHLDNFSATEVPTGCDAAPIVFDSFSRAATLIPSRTDTGHLWTGGGALATTDGLELTIPGGSNMFATIAGLTFVPGEMYSLSADVHLTAGGSFWTGIGFARPGSTDALDDTNGFILRRENPEIQLFQDSGGVQTIAVPDEFPSKLTVHLIAGPTLGSSGLIWEFDDEVVGEPRLADAGGIDRIFLAQIGAGVVGSIDNVALCVPEPGFGSLLVAGSLALLGFGRRGGSPSRGRSASSP